MIIHSPTLRVFGIDWLEYFVNESPSWDYSPDGFRRRGYWVEERPYGTKTMAEMFKLLDQSGHPFIEIRRAPRGVNDPYKKTVYHMGDSYIRLDNLYCYDANPIGLMDEFLRREHYTFKKIYRIDLFLDITKFDENDPCKNVVKRIINHTYAKVNQTRRRSSGNDSWMECDDNWLSWGAPGSMVSTKFYNKTKEIQETKMKKTYIVEMWRQAGYIDNVLTISLANNPVDVWRLEFAIKGNAKGWVVVTKDEAEDGIEARIPHGPVVYSQPQGVLNAIANLIPYYFKFRIFDPNKRKSDCPEKILFKFSAKEVEKGYRLTSESDIDRVRHIETDVERIAANHLLKAATKLSTTRFYSSTLQLYQELTEEISAKSRSQYGKRTDIW